MTTKHIFLSLIAATGLSLIAVGDASAQSYPTKPIKLISANVAGGPNDAVARLVAQRLSSSLGQQVIVENRPGAGGTIGTNAVATAVPDGYTLLFATTTFVISPALYKDLNYDPRKSFTPIATVSSTSWVLVVEPSVPVKSVPELVAYAKANPGKLNYGSGIGTPPHLLGEMFKVKTGTEIVYIPYRGAAPTITDLLGGRIQLAIENITGLLPHLHEKKVRPLAVTSAMRRPELPDVPTFMESGLTGFPTGNWTGVLAPAGTPANIIGRLNSAINGILKAAETRANFAKIGIEARIGSAQDFAQLIANEAPVWAAMVNSSGAKVD
jgi:tripartite-type tricarboxylate transporter receptor subunit TctC